MSSKTMASVYAIQSDDGLVKIGVSTNPESRIKTISMQGNRVIVARYVSPPTRSAYSIEALMHKQHADKRVVGEWFRVNHESISRMIDEAVATHTEDAEEKQAIGTHCCDIEHVESTPAANCMKLISAIFGGLKTPTDQNLAAALLMSLMKQKPKRKRKEKSA